MGRVVACIESTALTEALRWAEPGEGIPVGSGVPPPPDKLQRTSNTIVLPLIFGIWFGVFPIGTARRPIQLQSATRRPECRNSVCRNRVCRNSVCRNRVCRNSVCRNSVCRNSVCRNRVCRNSVCRNSVCRNRVCRNSVCRNSVCRNRVCRNSVCRNRVCRNSVCRNRVCRNRVCRNRVCRNSVCRNSVCRNSVCRNRVCRNRVCRNSVVYPCFLAVSVWLITLCVGRYLPWSSCVLAAPGRNSFCVVVDVPTWRRFQSESLREVNTIAQLIAVISYHVCFVCVLGVIVYQVESILLPNQIFGISVYLLVKFVNSDMFADRQIDQTKQH